MQGLGLLGLLVVVALAFYLMFAAGGSGSAGTALKAKQHSEQEIYKATGHDTQGAAATDSIKYEGTDKGVRVTAVTPGGAFETKYGIAVDDVILDIGPLSYRDLAGDYKGALMQSYSRDDVLVVQRGSRRIKLPDQRNETAAAVAPADTQTPPQADQSAPPPPVQRTTPRSQLDGLLKRPSDAVPSH